MKRRYFARAMVSTVATLALVALAAPAAFAQSKAELDEAMSHDGLQRIKVKGIDLAYSRPGASLAGYNAVMIDPIDVSFRKDWDPTKPGSRTKLSTAERDNIRRGVADIVREELVKELQGKSVYKVVTAPGPDVLRVRAAIANLYVNAPDTMSAGRTRTYAVSAGEMTLVAELLDSETGSIVSRVIDRREAQGTGTMTLTNSVVNAAEARSIASSWARILRSRLDAAHGIGRK